VTRGGPYDLIGSFEAHYAELLRYLTRLTGNAERAADVAQDIYLRLTAVPEGGPVIQNPRAYLFRVAGNLAVDALRKEGRSAARAAPESLGVEVEDPLASPEAQLLARERVQLLDEALRDLSPKARQALLLSRLEGATFAQIAARLGVSESMVAKYIAQALRACRDRLHQADAEN
jgi:RNA polymerase sigma factor (sigma-70 family)